MGFIILSLLVISSSLKLKMHLKTVCFSGILGRQLFLR